MHLDTLSELSRALHQRSISSVELTRHMLNRIETYDKQLNCFITCTPKLALEQAQRADRQIATGNAGPLTGIPLAHKDIFCTRGIKTSCGSKMLDNFISPYDATVVKKCEAAGMVMVGKTNMDEFAMGPSNETSYYGPCRNPWKSNHTPGGSSGGSAAAVAARLVPAATGTDTGGSIRQPASFSGITGLKPTYGRISRFGMIAFASSLDQCGPMTQTVEDAALLLAMLSGHDPKDSTSINQPVPDYHGQLNRHKDLSSFTIGLPKQYFNPDLLDKETMEAIQTAIRLLEKNGARIKELDLPHTDQATATYYVIAPAECASNLARYDGVRYGHRCADPGQLSDLYQRSRSEGFGDEVKRRIIVGTYVLSAGYYDAYYHKAQQLRRLIARDFQSAFEQVDLLLTPTVPSPAFKLSEKCDKPVKMYSSDIFTIATNLAGLPGLSIPTGFSQAGLPIGLQLIGQLCDELTLLQLGHFYQQISDWHRQVPKTFQ